jgi:hypothetical protein
LSKSLFDTDGLAVDDEDMEVQREDWYEGDGWEGGSGGGCIAKVILGGYLIFFVLDDGLRQKSVKRIRRRRRDLTVVAMATVSSTKDRSQTERLPDGRDGELNKELERRSGDVQRVVPWKGRGRRR